MSIFETLVNASKKSLRTRQCRGIPDYKNSFLLPLAAVVYVIKARITRIFNLTGPREDLWRDKDHQLPFLLFDIFRFEQPAKYRNL